MERHTAREEAIVSGGESNAFIDGAPVAFDAAVQEAAQVIRKSALPAIAHLGADIDGAREAVLLASEIGGVIDHAASDALLRDLDPLRESGGLQTTPLEAKVRADVALVVGAAPEWLAQPAHPYEDDIPRRIVRLGATGDDLLRQLAALRARVKQRPVARSLPDVEENAATLRGAKFGVALWNAAELAPLAVEALHALVRDLNETTRFSTLASAAPDNGLGVQTTLAWMTGFALRTGFARGRAEHDPWRYDARRLAAASETDCVIWISAFQPGAAPPPGVAVALGEAGAAHVRFAVANPGAETDAILYDARVGTLIATCAASPAKAPTVAATLRAIRQALGATPC